MGEAVRIIHADCREAIKTLADCSIDSCVTDPPYALVSITKRFGADNAAPAKSKGASGVYKRASAGFMGQKWDTGETAFDPAFWREVLRVLKPGAHLIAFGGSRTYHRMACAIEDAGFEIRDQIQWLYGSGFPKSLAVTKAIDKLVGAEGIYGAAKDARRQNAIEAGRTGREAEGWDRPWKNDPAAVERHSREYRPGSEAAKEWDGWGTALKPAHEPIVLARKPFDCTVAENVLANRTGALNIDGCRVEWAGPEDAAAAAAAAAAGFSESRARGTSRQSQSIGKESRDGTNNYFPNEIKGRWPANIVLSYPVDEYELSPYITAEQKRDVYRWLSENA